MDWSRISFLELPDSGDARGSSFPVPASWLDSPFMVEDVHISALLPGQVRGDHYHVKRKEILIVPSGPAWSLFYDDGPETAPRQQEFGGSGAVVVSVPILFSHAIRNDGNATMSIIGLTDGPYDSTTPDAVTRKVSTGE